MSRNGGGTGTGGANNGGDTQRPGGGNNSGKRAKVRAKRQLRRNARQDVALSLQPQYDQLNTQLQQAQQDFLRSQQYAQSAYGGYQDELKDLDRPQFGRIADDLESRLSGLGGYFSGTGVGPESLGMQGVGMMADEVAAGEGFGAATASAGLQGLANMDAREGMYRSSAGREGALSERYLHDNLLQSMQDTMQTYNNQLSNITAQQPAMIRSRMDELREQALERKLANSQIRGDRAFNKYLQEFLTGQATSDRDGRTPIHDSGFDGGGDNGGRDEDDRVRGVGAGPRGSQPPTYPAYVGPSDPAPDYQAINEANGPWDSRAHPIADYVSGGLAKGYEELTPARQQWIEQNIQKYAQTHPEAFQRSGWQTQIPGYPQGGSGLPKNPSAQQLIDFIEGVYY